MELFTRALGTTASVSESAWRGSDVISGKALQPRQEESRQREMELLEKEAKLIRTFVRGQLWDEPDLR